VDTQYAVYSVTLNNDNALSVFTCQLDGPVNFVSARSTWMNLWWTWSICLH